MNIPSNEARNAPTGGMGEGGLVVRVSTARGAIPLEGARVDVRSIDGALDAGRSDVITSLVSGRDGNTELIRLPAPPRSASLSPGNGKPYATYLIEVTLEGYARQDYQDVPIFDGIIAVQPADLIPLAENGRTDGRSPDGETVFEGGGPEL